MDDSLRRAARDGDVRDLYTIIERDGNILRRFEEVEFIETPLHLAAEEGRIDFAMEMMSLKPAFARKLNQQGLSPLHLAVENGHKKLALLLLGIDKDVVRIKGKKGETPFHYAITREANPQLLSRFLEACPECILDLTTENQSALHIAVITNKLEVVKFLCERLRKTDYFEDVVNQRDINGNTALHIAARDNQHEMLKLLLKCKVDKHVTDEDDRTALDVAEQLNNNESIRILRGYCLTPRISTLINKLHKQLVKYVTKASLVIFKNMDNISGDDRNAFLVILGLLLTTTFQASISPPGSVWQNESTTIYGDTKTPGEAIMNQDDFLLFYIPTCAVFIVAFFLTLALLKPYPRGFRTALQALLASLAICFLQSISFLAPNRFASLVILVFSILVFVLMMLMCIAYRVSKFSVLILGWWLYASDDLHNFMSLIVVGFLLILILVEDFGKGTILLLAYGLYVVLISFSLYVPPFAPIIVVGFMLFFYLIDEFWKGTFVVIVSGILLVYMDKPWHSVILLIAFWFFYSLCRFWIKRCKVCCN